MAYKHLLTAETKGHRWCPFVVKHKSKVGLTGEARFNPRYAVWL